MVAISECEEVRKLEQSVPSKHQNSANWFESSADNSDLPFQQSIGSPGHNLHEACRSSTASSAGFDHFDVYNKLTKKGWKKSADCSICDTTQNMEPCVPDM
jgi:hypothetical protein